MKDKSTKIVFFGTPEFAAPTLQALVTEGYNVVLVVTQPDEPVGRKQILTPTPIKVEAKKLGLEVCEEILSLKPCPERSRGVKTNGLKFDLGVVVAYGKIIPQTILDLFPLGCLNIHPSLLPKYRGASPIQSAILNGDQETGVTIFKLDAKMDHGERLANVVYCILDGETHGTLSKKLAQTGADLMIKTLPDYLAGKIKLEPQDDSQATYCTMVKKEDGRIDWNKSAEQIERQIRAYAPWPGSYSEFDINNKKIKIKITFAHIYKNVGAIHESPLPGNKPSLIGKFTVANGQLFVHCGHGALLINKLQPEGKKELTAKEFINGYLN